MYVASQDGGDISTLYVPQQLSLETFRKHLLQEKLKGAALVISSNRRSTVRDRHVRRVAISATAAAATYQSTLHYAYWSRMEKKYTTNPGG